MANIPFDRYNMDFSLWAHEKAREQIYLPAYGTAEFVQETGTKADFWKGIDLRLRTQDGKYSIQERFRRAKYSHYRELTATLANYASRVDGDFFKLKADHYVYGYIGDDGVFIEAIIVDVPRLKTLYRTNQIRYTKQYYRRKKQEIIAFPFSALKMKGAVLWHSFEPDKSLITP